MGDLHAAMSQREFQWRETADVARVNIRSGIDQDFHDIEVAGASGFVQGGGAGLASMDSGGIDLHQGLHFVQIADRSRVL